MKKVLILSIAVMILASCSKNGYEPIQRNNNNNSNPATPSDVDPAASFNTLWISEEPAVAFTDNTAKRTFANFFGYNTAHYANLNDLYLGPDTTGDGLTDWVHGSCAYGYTDDSTTNTIMIPSTGQLLSAPCYSSSDFLRNYFTPSSTDVNLFPAPMDIGAVIAYKVRFAADVDEATRDIIVGGNAYLQIIMETASETFSREFVTMKSKVSVIPFGANYLVSASWTDECGSVTFHAHTDGGSVLTTPWITFKQSKDSYKNKSCYHDGSIPVDPTELKWNDEIPNSIPAGLMASGYDVGNALLYLGFGESFADLIEQ